MNRLSVKKRASIINMLVEGNSLRATSRIADVSINTVTKLLIDIGSAAVEYQKCAFVDLPCKNIQVDEIWAFCYTKQANVEKAKAAPRAAGNVWTWVAICEDTKLVPCFLVGERNRANTVAFMEDLYGRLSNKIQLTTDGYPPYVDAVEAAFGNDIDYGVLVKIKNDEFIPCEKTIVTGAPDYDRISTSIVERQNLTMRMSIRRFGRKTNAFSKKIDNHHYAVGLHFFYYNFCRVHKSINVTPAMEAGVSDFVWDIEDMIRLLS